MKTFADKVIRFNKRLSFKGALPENIQIMNPFKEDKEALRISSFFYHKYYNDSRSRHLILGINPGRFGAGLTGIPFTDPKRLTEKCAIDYTGKITHEPSSVFIYDMIQAYGGPENFYRDFYIHSVCPLGFTRSQPNGTSINYNYYDDQFLARAMSPFIVQNIQTQLAFGIYRHTCVCLGTGKNEAFLRRLNHEHHFFENIVALEHPRFIMQYKSKQKEHYVHKYITTFQRITNFQKEIKSV